MNTFTFEIQSPLSGIEHIDNVISFSGRDATGSFGILANAERRIIVLEFGLASFHYSDQSQEFLALPGGLIYFERNHLRLVTQKFVRSSNLSQVSAALETEIRASEAAIQETKRSFRRLDEEILKRMTQLNKRSKL